jgi:pyruvate dehydrogenase E1 component
MVDDIDPIETKEWLDALRSVIKVEGGSRASYLIEQVFAEAAGAGVPAPAVHATPYQNTIPAHLEDKMPDDGQHLETLTNIMRWNAIAMVMRAGKVNSELGGHIASFGSIATLFEVGFQYFFHAKSAGHGGDLIYFQGHSSPGIYARAYLEGRLQETHLDGFRQEITRQGISSYPHPWLMPDFWQFPTVSMGLGPLMAIYQAHFLKYLGHRGLADVAARKVWAFCGDGELGEPESLGALNLAGRLQLDNLIFVINCNLQRLDGPVWGNGQIIQEYDGVFRGAGWNVIKVIWGSGWQRLFEKDQDGLLIQRMSQLVDGEYQLYSGRDGAYMREHFFGQDPQLLALVEDWSDDEIKALQDGGHDPQKVYAAYAAAVKHTGQPTVILAKTVKGYGMGAGGEAQNVTHQTKKLSVDDLRQFCQRFGLPLKDQEIEQLTYYKPEAASAEMQYLKQQRAALGGFLPARSADCEALVVPDLTAFKTQLAGTGDRQISSTMAFVRILSVLLKDPHIKDRVVPIVADESRTFGMEGLFRQIGIYSPFGQRYEPEDRKTLMYYREDEKGQLLQEGISEQGAMSSWIAAANSYAANGVAMIPFYVYYSMFGFQRFGDLAWAAGDIRARGFIMGGTAGRTTLAGEGLQHQDGHNIIMFSMVPNCVTYDPTFAYELAVIIQDGLRRMYVEQEDVYYYLNIMNENYAHPAMPEGVEANILKGMYLLKAADKTTKKHVRLLGSGTILLEVMAAAEILEKDYAVSVDVWSVTSFNELRKDVESVARYHRLHPGEAERQSHVRHCLSGCSSPVVAATDYMKLFADQVRSDIDAAYYVLGTDGYGRSDGRAALRDFFEVDAKMVVYTALKALCDQGDFEVAALKKAMKKLGIDPNRPDPISC